MTEPNDCEDKAGIGPVRCPACGSEVYLLGYEWPEPEEYGPGEGVVRWFDCDAEFGDGRCDEPIQCMRVVSGDGRTMGAVYQPQEDLDKIAVMDTGASP